MNTEEVATKLVEHCRTGEWMQAVNDLYAKDIVSVEPREMENMPSEMRGIDQVRGRRSGLRTVSRCTAQKVGGPFVARDTFVVQFDIDVTDKARTSGCKCRRWEFTRLKTARSRVKNSCRSLNRKVASR